MKKLTTTTVKILGIIFLVAAFFSCKKTVDYSNGCWECIDEVGTNVTHTNTCDIDNKEAFKRSSVRPYPFNGVLYFTRQSQFDSLCRFKKR